MDSSNEQSPVLMSVDPTSEPKITIDADLRIITVPEELVDIGVVGDHYAETVYFDCPRFFDGVDLSLKSCEIHFINAAGFTGISKAIDVVPGDSQISFGWEIDRRVTIKSGKISFAIFFCSTDERGYQFSTTAASMNVLAGLDEGQTITAQDNTILQQIQYQLAEMYEQLNTINNNITELQKADIDTSNSINIIEGKLNKLTEDVNFISDNVIYTSNSRN